MENFVGIVAGITLLCLVILMLVLNNLDSNKSKENDPRSP